MKTLPELIEELEGARGAAPAERVSIPAADVADILRLLEYMQRQNDRPYRVVEHGGEAMGWTVVVPTQHAPGELVRRPSITADMVAVSGHDDLGAALVVRNALNTARPRNRAEMHEV